MYGEAQIRLSDVNRLLKATSPEMRELLKLAHKQGFRISRTGRHHFRVLPPEGSKHTTPVFAPGTPSDVRSVHNVQRKLRAVGLRIPRS